VKTNVWQIRPFQQLLELVDYVAGYEKITNECAEDVIMLLPEFACLEPHLFLSQVMLLQGLESKIKRS
jgi:hypothetical protein